MSCIESGVLTLRRKGGEKKRAYIKQRKEADEPLNEGDRYKGGEWIATEAERRRKAGEKQKRPNIV